MTLRGLELLFIYILVLAKFSAVYVCGLGGWGEGGGKCVQCLSLFGERETFFFKLLFCIYIQSKVKHTDSFCTHSARFIHKIYTRRYYVHRSVRTDISSYCS